MKLSYDVEVVRDVDEIEPAAATLGTCVALLSRSTRRE